MRIPELIKICGLSDEASVDAVIDGGATHTGFIFFEKSPRHISLEQASTLSAHIGDRIQKVAVTVNADDDYLDGIVASLKPDMLQLHGSETLDRVDEVKARYNLPVMKVFAIRSADDLKPALAYTECADLFMFDAKAPKGSELPGGNGVSFDWDILDEWPKTMPYVLSGGLSAENLPEALKYTNCTGIDVSSGVETSPGKKDTKLISEFLKFAR